MPKYRFSQYERYVMRYHMRSIIGQIRNAVDKSSIPLDKAILNLLWAKYRAKCSENKSIAVS